MRPYDEMQSLLVDLIIASKLGTEEDEDRIRDDMDPLWFKLSKEERESIEFLSARLYDVQHAFEEDSHE